MNHSIKQWPAQERPRERLLLQGAESLSDAEDSYRRRRPVGAGFGRRRNRGPRPARPLRTEQRPQ